MIAGGTPGLGECDREVAGGERLARSALRAEHGDHGAFPHGSRRAAPAGDRLLERERQLLGRLRQRDQVVGAGAERTLHEAVRAPRVEHDERRPLRELPREARDALERPLVLVAAGEDHEVGLCRRLRERGPQVGRVGQGRLGHPGSRRQCLLDRRRVDAVLEYQDGAVGDGCHRRPPSACRTTTGRTPSRSVSGRDETACRRLRSGRRPQRQPELAVVRREGDLRRILVGDAEADVAGPRRRADAGAAAEADDLDVLHDQPHDRAGLTAVGRRAIRPDPDDVEAGVHVDAIALLDIAAEPVCSVERDSDDPLPVAERARERVGARGEVGRRQLRALVDRAPSPPCPLRLAGSLNAPSRSWLSRMVVTVKRPLVAMTAAGGALLDRVTGDEDGDRRGRRLQVLPVAVDVGHDHDPREYGGDERRVERAPPGRDDSLCEFHGCFLRSTT